MLRLAGLLVLLLIAGSVLAQVDGQDYLVEVQVNGVAMHDYLPLIVRTDGILMVPAEWIWLAGEAEAVREDGRLRLAVANTGESLEVDPRSGRAVVGGVARSLAPVEAVEFDDEILISAPLLQEAFEVDFKFNEFTQQLSVRSRRPWPRDLRIARMRTWARLGMVETDGVPVRIVDMPYRAWGTPQADVGVSFGRDADGGYRGDYRVYGVAEAGWMTHYLSGAGDTGKALSSLRWSAGRLSPEGGLLGLSEFREFRMGDISGLRQTLVGGGQSGRGLRFQAAPLTTATDFDATVVEGTAPPGWEAELYLGTRLLDFQRVGEEGRYRFEEVPLDYGLNRIRVVLYGPQGQVNEDVVAKRIGGAMVPPGRLYSRGWINEPNRSVFGIDAGGRGRGETAWVGGLQADYGVSNWLTLGAHATRALGEDGDVSDFVGLDLRPVLGRFGVDLGGAHQFGGGEAAYVRVAAPLGPVSASLGWFHYGDGFQSAENDYGLLERIGTARIGLPLRFGKWNAGSLSLGAESRWGRDGQVSHTRNVTLGHRLGPAYLSHQFSQRGTTDSGADSDWDSQYRLLASFQVEAWDLRGEVQRTLESERSFDTLTASARWRPRDGESLALGAAYTPDGQTSWTLGWFRDWERLTFSLNAAHSPDGTTVGAGLSFSIGQAPGGGMAMSSRARADRGMVEAFVYEDLNASGRYDPDSDRPVPGGTILVNGSPYPVRTSAQGRLLLDSLSPLSPVTLEVSQAGLPDEFLVPMSPPLQAWPRPGQTLRVDIAVTDSAGIGGYVYRRLPLAQTQQRLRDRIEGETLLRPVPRLRVQILDAEGRLHAETLTLSDGYYSVETVFPGTWTVRVAPGQTLGSMPLDAPARDAVIEPGQVMAEGVDLEVSEHATQAP